jgi:hypothetical protein
MQRCVGMFGMFVLVVILAAGPDACRHVDMYKPYPTTTGTST